MTETKKVQIRQPKLAVTEGTIAKTAMRLLSQRLVSVEVQYVQRVLGTSATQHDIDMQVLAVRKMPWAQIYSE